MTTSAAPAEVAATLDDDAQALIDARLDTIERMLGFRTTRSDRLAIVREVESQIYDHLTERNPDDTDRDAVIAALARLDAPEAYQPEAFGPSSRPRPTLPGMTAASPRPAIGPRKSRNGQIAARMSAVVGLMGVLSCSIVVPNFLATFRHQPHPVSMMPMLLPPVLATFYAQSIVAIAASAYARFAGWWALAGLGFGVITAVLCAMWPIFLQLR